MFFRPIIRNYFSVREEDESILDEVRREEMERIRLQQSTSGTSQQQSTSGQGPSIMRSLSQDLNLTSQSSAAWQDLNLSSQSSAAWNSVKKKFETFRQSFQTTANLQQLDSTNEEAETSV